MKNSCYLKSLLLALCLISLLFSCEKEDEEYLSTNGVNLEEISIDRSPEVKLLARLNETIGLSGVTDRGFLIATFPDAKLDGKNTRKIAIGKLSSNQDLAFSAVVNNLHADSIYYGKAYFIKKGKVYFSRTGQFSLKKVVVYGISARELERGDELTISGDNFSSIPERNIVKLDNQVVQVLSVSQNRTLRVRIPNDIAGNFFVSVTTAGYTSVASESLHVRHGISLPMADLPQGLCRTVSFSIGNKGYVVAGRINSEWNNQLWEYDVLTNKWERKADFPGKTGSEGVAFSISSVGYVGFFVASEEAKSKEFWAYDAALNTWVRKNDFPGTAISNGIGFNIGDKGYVGAGIATGGGGINEFWEYNPFNDRWIRKADFPKNSTFTINAFAIQNTEKAYVVQHNEVWEYSARDNTWARKNDFPGLARQWPVAFSIGSKGYYGSGRLFNYNHSFDGDIWEYSPNDDKWLRCTNIKNGTEGATAFVVASKAYIVGGLNKDGIQRNVWEYEAK